jgi:hypothetical protein
MFGFRSVTACPLLVMSAALSEAPAGALIVANSATWPDRAKEMEGDAHAPASLRRKDVTVFAKKQ